MHLNYYVLKRLCRELQPLLVSGQFIEAYSQQKDELIIALLDQKDRPLWIRATLTHAFTCLSFPEDLKKSRKNSINLFRDLEGQRVSRIRVFTNERAFALVFHDGSSLLFKMHGNRSNVIHYNDGIPIALFKNNLKADRHLIPDQLDRVIPGSEQRYLENPDPTHFFPTFGRLIRVYLDRSGFASKTPREQWALLKNTEDSLNTNPFFLTTLHEKPVLSLLPIGGFQELSYSALESLNVFYKKYMTWYGFEKEQREALQKIESRLGKLRRYLTKTEARLTELIEGVRPGQIADLIMANLHRIPANASSVTLFNFYTHKDIRIKLNKDLSANKNAERYYKKSKNRGIEEHKLRENLEKKRKSLQQLEQLKSSIRAIEDLKTLRKFLKNNDLLTVAKKKQVRLPYRVFETAGYTLWIGKDARSNDELTLKYTHKEDLWLHARDVPGSHVVIKHQPGRKIPGEVLERGAELAAYYSKRKTDTIVPVIFTPAKYVRKRKGSLPGQVTLLKEEVIMVPAKGPQNG